MPWVSQNTLITKTSIFILPLEPNSISWHNLHMLYESKYLLKNSWEMLLHSINIGFLYQNKLKYRTIMIWISGINHKCLLGLPLPIMLLNQRQDLLGTNKVFDWVDRFSGVKRISFPRRLGNPGQEVLPSPASVLVSFTTDEFRRETTRIVEMK